MKIGLPKEIKNNESRVGLTPAGVYELTRNGHEVFVQTNAGIHSGYEDEEYEKVGAINSFLYRRCISSGRHDCQG